MCAHKSSVPDNITEEYYQISLAILDSFPKYRPPLDLFVFKEDVCQLQTYSRKGQRLTNEQVEEINNLCQTGDLFVSRSDHPVYSKHICKQLDLVLVDANLKEAEIADIFFQALPARLEEFFDQPVQAVYERLDADIMVLTEYLNEDQHRIKALMRRLKTAHTLPNHSMNTAVVGLWLLFRTRKELRRRDLDRTAQGLFLHDLGMSKVPQFIRDKTVPLTKEDREKVVAHSLTGARIMGKLGIKHDEIMQCILEHHERLDGSGYPRKTADQQISSIGQLAAAADSFCAMITDRPYAKAMEPAEAGRELVKAERLYNRKYTMLLAQAFVTGTF
ncbi:MAG: HD domain-containing protein [Desulfovibrionaceae bacterium]|jgi:HD-GYP domain-containing protein (c-di-GMP phosphodiesterase class II)|nr:HD domain-containing protein [Desulfovibrionaceae bacterium]